MRHRRLLLEDLALLLQQAMLHGRLQLEGLRVGVGVAEVVREADSFVAAGLEVLAVLFLALGHFFWGVAGLVLGLEALGFTLHQVEFEDAFCFAVFV